jgi:hypothetical protein
LAGVAKLEARPRNLGASSKLSQRTWEPVEANVEFFQRKVMLDACALDFVVRFERMSKCAQMLTPVGGGGA